MFEIIFSFSSSGKYNSALLIKKKKKKKRKIFRITFIDLTTIGYSVCEPVYLLDTLEVLTRTL